jgi:medium-chain acyl-[acyl-carrier-protein] hydrolase
MLVNFQMLTFSVNDGQKNMKTADPGRKSSVSMPEPNIWKQTCQVRSYEVDSHHRLSVLSIFNFMQEAASRHAEALGVSIQQLLSENYTWLLSRLKIKIASFPVWKDRIQISTWPSGAQRLFALRDFELQDKDDQTIAAAVSAWLVLNVQKRRPVRIAPFVERLKPLEGDHILPDTLDKLPGLEFRTHEKKFVVRFTDLDINQHVNNASFVEWLVESIPVRVLNTSVLAELEINFLAEAFYEDHILAACHPLDSQYTSFHHSLIRQQDNQELVRARTVWRKVD